VALLWAVHDRHGDVDDSVRLVYGLLLRSGNWGLGTDRAVAAGRQDAVPASGVQVCPVARPMKKDARRGSVPSRTRQTRTRTTERERVAPSTTSPPNVGFLTVLQEPSGYLGGYLVTNLWGRPLEFRLTSAVQPNKVQQILYGDTLLSY